MMARYNFLKNISNPAAIYHIINVPFKENALPESKRI
jgi:hypothetical protein